MTEVRLKNEPEGFWRAEELSAYKKKLEQEIEVIKAERKRHMSYENFKADTHSYDEYEAKQCRIAADYEINLSKRKHLDTQMTFEEIVYCLVKEGVSPSEWCILGKERVYGYDGYVVKHSDVSCGFDIYYMERGEYTLLRHCKNEHETCKVMLKLFAQGGRERLKLYIR